MIRLREICDAIQAGSLLKPIYVICGEEMFQVNEILQTFRKRFSVCGDNLSIHEFEGDHLDPLALRDSLDTMSLFADPNSTTSQLVICQHFEKVSASQLESLSDYFDDPALSTCFVLAINKLDRRKSWVKKLDQQVVIIEVKEPYDREWPVWASYFEKKIGKTIAPEAWRILVESSSRTLALVAMEIEKIAVAVGSHHTITEAHAYEYSASNHNADIFGFVEHIVNQDKKKAVGSFCSLKTSDENEVKILSLLVRQFHLVAKYLGLKKDGINDSKKIASDLGVHPFFLPKIEHQAKKHSAKTVHSALSLLAQCDYRLKTGQGGLFENFLVPYLYSTT